MINSIYIDMDGVVADFDKHFENETGHKCEDYEKEFGQIQFWRKVYKTPKFFEYMPPFDWFLEIVSLSLKITDDVTFLSSPSTTNHPLCVIQKRIWLDNHYGDFFPAIFEKRKEIYASPDALLIDDSEHKVKRWREAGGRAILFQDWDDCKKVLIKLAEGKEV